MKRALTLLILLMSPMLLAQTKLGGVYLFPGEGLEELAGDMTEVLISNLSDGSDLSVMPKERFLTRTKEVSKRYAKDCLTKTNCARKVGYELNMKLLAVGALEKSDAGYTLQITRYSVAGGEDVTHEYEGIPDIPKLMKQIKLLAVLLKKAEGSYLTILSEEEGATVFVDDKFIGVLPVKPFAISEGFHKLMVKKKGFKDFRSKVSCKAGRKCEIKVRLVAGTGDGNTAAVMAPIDEAPAAVTQQTGGGGKTWRIVGFTGLGLGAAVLGTGVYFMTDAGATSDYLDSNCFDSGGATYCRYSRATMNSKVDAGKSSMTMANVFMGVGAGVMTASTAVLIFMWNHGADDAPPAAAAQIVPSFAPGYGGLTATLSF